MKSTMSGVDNGRADLLLCLKAVFEESGIECDIRLLASGLNKKRRQELKSILTDKRLSYEEYLTQLQRCSLILDITQFGQVNGSHNASNGSHLLVQEANHQ